MTRPWFKHYNNASKKDVFVALKNEFGPHIGYACYFQFIEYFHSIWNGEEGKIFQIFDKDLKNLLQVSSKKLQDLLRILEDSDQISVEKRSNIYEIKIPKLLEIQDKDSKYNRKRIVSESQKTTLDKEEEEEEEEDKEKKTKKKTNQTKPTGCVKKEVLASYQFLEAEINAWLGSVSNNLKARWLKKFGPDVLEREITKAYEWNLGQPDSKKKKAIGSFISNWLSRVPKDEISLEEKIKKADARLIEILGGDDDGK